MIAIIRIKGMIGLKRGIAETLHRLRLRRKYACIVIPKSTAVDLGMVKKVRNFVAFGEIDKPTFSKLVEARAQLVDKSKKLDAKAVEELMNGKSYEDLNLKPFFRLHPPRGGIDAKKHFGVAKGVLGNNDKAINKLIGRMI